MTPWEMVTPFKLSVELKAAGVPQGSTCWLWEQVVPDSDEAVRLFRAVDVPYDHRERACAAFTLGELFEVLGKYVNSVRVKDSEYQASGWRQTIGMRVADTFVDGVMPQEALGQLLLILAKGEAGDNSKAGAAGQ